MLRIESFVIFSKFFKKYVNLPAIGNVFLASFRSFLQMGELFGSRLNLKSLLFLISELWWM